MLESNPYSPPSGASQESGSRPFERGVVRSIFLGTLAVLGAAIPSALIAGLIFGMNLPADFDKLPSAQRHDVMVEMPYVKPVVILIWVFGMIVGGFIGARKWRLISTGIATVYLSVWAIPSIAIAAGRMSVTQWICFAALIPSALVGGYLAKVRNRDRPARPSRLPHT